MKVVASGQVKTGRNGAATDSRRYLPQTKIEWMTVAKHRQESKTLKVLQESKRCSFVYVQVK
jgi:hypothetical protein